MAKERNTKEESWQDFLKLCNTFPESKNLNAFFNLFFTLEEKEMFSSRFLIIKTLLEGKMTQREIAEKHKVSIAQITRGSNALKIIDPKLKKVLKDSLMENPKSAQ